MSERGDEAQMMLLGAIVLVIGFLILSSLVARVSQVAQETAQDSEALLREAAAVERGIVELDAGVAGVDDFEESLRHLQIIQAARGYRLDLFSATSPSLVLDCVLGDLRVGLASGQGSIALLVPTSKC